MAAVRKIKEYIRAGDIIQAVPSQRLSLETTADPFSSRRKLARGDRRTDVPGSIVTLALLANTVRDGADGAKALTSRARRHAPSAIAEGVWRGTS